MWFRLILGILAVYRLSQLIAIDLGPYKILQRIRIYLGNHPNSRIRESLGMGINCPYCLGFWWALLIGSILFPPGLTWIDWAIAVMGIWGGQTILQSAFEGER